MKSRNSLNSNILKSRFPEIYQEFFSKCQLVVSAPHFFTLAGEYTGHWGGMMLTQKIPLRIYVGLEVGPGGKNKNYITIEDNAKSYSIKDDSFKYDKYDPLLQQRLLEFINNYYKLKKYNQTLKIHVLSEFSLGGTGSSSVFSAALGVLLALKNKKIEFEDIEKWKKTSSHDLIEDKKLKFDSVFRFCWKIAAAYRSGGGHTSGVVIFTVLLPSSLPVFYCIAGNKDIKLPLTIKENFEILEQVPVMGGRIEELFNIKKIPPWPVDFALISLGEPRGAIPFSTEELEDAFLKAKKFIGKELKNFICPEEKTSSSFFCHLNFWESHLQVSNALNVFILIKLGELLTSGAREDIIRSFLRSIDKHQSLFLLLGMNSPQVNAADSIIHQEAFKVDDLGAGIKTFSTTQKGVLLFFMPNGTMSQIIDSIKTRIKKELKLDIQIIYASCFDGIEEEGVKVEQDLDQKIYSEFISKDTVYVKDFSQKNVVNLLLSPEEFNKRKKGIDLLLAENEGKIYIRGGEMTSNELHSKKATIELLKILLSKQEKEIKNSELPSSSYSKDRYELQGKIVIPLIKIVEKITKKKMDFKISGGITDFSLKLNIGQVKIWLVE